LLLRNTGSRGRRSLVSRVTARQDKTQSALADLDHLRIETTDLSERDILRVKIGQPVTVLVKPLNQSVAGRVSQIGLLASTLGGDVVYKVTIDLDTIPTGLRAGMSVEVQLGG
jgi:macrolide-specific efflux system membrane fusion protein